MIEPVARKPDKPAKSEAPTRAARKISFDAVTAEEIETAGLSGRAQKVLFAVKDLFSSDDKTCCCNFFIDIVNRLHTIQNMPVIKMCGFIIKMQPFM